MPTAAQIAIIDREIAMFKSGAMSGDFMRRPGQRPGPGPQEQQIIRQLTISKMSPVEKIIFDKRELEAKRFDTARRGFINAFKSYKPATLTKVKTNATIEKLRALSLDDSNPDQWLLFYRQIYAREIVGVPLGKFRFEWGANGKPVFVPWSEQAWTNFFENMQRGRWIPNIPAMYKCPPEWATHWIKEYTGHSENAAKQFPANDPRHVWQYKSGDAKCRRPKKSTWVKIRKGVVGAALVVAAVYLGPVILAKVKAIAGGAAGATGTTGATGAATAATTTSAVSTATAIVEATTFQQIQAGSATLLGYINKARTVDAIVKGKLPPPPISIVGSSFRDWAFIVAKEKLQEEAMQAGQDYIVKKMTEKEEARLRAEIAEMQRQLIAMMPPEVLKMPPQPDPDLPAVVKNIQVIEETRQSNLQQLIIPGAIVAGLLLMGV